MIPETCREVGEGDNRRGYGSRHPPSLCVGADIQSKNWYWKNKYGWGGGGYQSRTVIAAAHLFTLYVLCGLHQPWWTTSNTHLLSICLAFSHNTLFLSVFCAWYFLRKGLFLNFVSFQICPVHFCCLRVTVLPLLTRPVPFVPTFAFFSVHDISNILLHVHIFTISCLRLPKVYLVTTANFVGKRQIKDQEVTTWITCLHGIIQTSNYTWSVIVVLLWWSCEMTNHNRLCL